MKKSLVSFGALALVGMAGAAGFAEEYPDAQKNVARFNGMDAGISACAGKNTACF